MPLDLQAVLDRVNDVAATLFDADPSIRSVGVGEDGDAPGFYAVRNARAAFALAGRANVAPLPPSLHGVPIHYINSAQDPTGFARVPHSGPASPGVGSLVQEQQFHRPLVCGLQLQNFDDDLRTGEIAGGFMIVGTLGCFVTLNGNVRAMLSNNHVVAGENRGQRGHDRILQPGGMTFQPSMLAGQLTDFIPLVASAPGATPAQGNVHFNTVDAGTATLDAGVTSLQAYLPLRPVTAPTGTGTATIGDTVFKVGRTTGLTYGVIKQIGVVAQVNYGIGLCWFQQSIVVEGNNGALFSDHGDSGSAIVRPADNSIVGLLFAGNGTQTYACPIDAVMNALNCRLA